MQNTITTTLILIATSIFANAELPQQREYTYRERAASRGTQDLRIERAQRNQRESNLVNDEFTALCENVRLKVSAKYGGPEQALQHLDEIKSECRVVIFRFASKHNISDTLTWAYKMQEQVTISLQQKNTEVAKL
jgi:hypothetical protein